MSEVGDTRDASVLPGRASAADAASTRSTAPSVTGDTMFQPGSIIGGRYRVVRFLARGGMGEVYEAEDLELDLRIAIKTIRAERIGEIDSLGRLKREILAARRVSHPNVVRLHDVGFHVLSNLREVAFITMDLLAGETLDAYLRDNAPLAPAQAMPLVRQLAAGLDSAHMADVVHRDFKSQNVIVLPAGEGESTPRTVITDFGLAEAGTDIGSSTATVEFAGTPAYMAPEQVSRLVPVTKAADIYALGVVMFEMVTGKLPFVGKTALATAARRLEVAPPSPREIVPELPAAWADVIVRCLARDPAERFATAGAAVAALTEPPPRWRRPRRKRRVNRLAVVAAIGGVLAGGMVALAIRALPDEAGPAAALAPPCPAPAPGEIRVDAAAKPGGNGSAECPLRTISAALALPGERRTIRVARGTYDRQLGEDFPLVLRGDVRLVGAGVDRTAIVGTGHFDTSAGAGVMSDDPVLASMVVGDARGRVEIGELSLTPSLEGGRASFGVLCTRGNLSNFDEAMRPASTLLRGVAIGPGYRVGVMVGTETVPASTGCNLRIESARVNGGQVGVWAAGCGVGKGKVPTGLEVETTSFSGMHDSAPLSGAGVLVWDCTRRAVVRHSLFEMSDRGIAAVRHGTAELGTVRVESSTFRTLHRAGIALDRAVQLERLENNDFIHVKAPGPLDAPAPALQLRGVKGDFPAVVARANLFLQGDVGVELSGAPPAKGTASLDLGRPDEFGYNRFVCNSRGVDAAIPGGDVVLSLSSLAGGRLLLHGNVWDHEPPTVGRVPVNGLDVLVPRGLGGAVDVGAGRGTHDSCNLGEAGP